MKNIIRIIALSLVIIMVCAMVPCFTPLVIGEELPNLPTYKPVVLKMENPEAVDYQSPAPYAPNDDCYLPENGGYADDSISVRIEKFRAYDTDCLATWIQIASPTQLRTALSSPYPSKHASRVAEMAKRNNAVIAINGDYFVFHELGYVVKNGKVYRRKYNKEYDTLVIDDKGDMTIVKETTKDKIEQLENSGCNVVNTLTFGPGLVIDSVKQDKPRHSMNGVSKAAQRMIIAQMDTLSYLIVCTEGPENKGSRGLTLDEAAQLMSDIGVKQAYNLDGGSSSTLAFKGQKINSLSSNKIRSVGDIVYFITACPDK